ncbi:hypothetical protein TRVL_04595 [Trypanosoma vivax]|nr:hypothetical protein TRVL_04595 [Trypanosoma vivax]
MKCNVITGRRWPCEPALAHATKSFCNLNGLLVQRLRAKGRGVWDHFASTCGSARGGEGTLHRHQAPRACITARLRQRSAGRVLPRNTPARRGERRLRAPQGRCPPHLGTAG